MPVVEKVVEEIEEMHTRSRSANREKETEEDEQEKARTQGLGNIRQAGEARGERTHVAN